MKLLKPKKLSENKTVGLIAPSGFITKEILEDTINFFRKLGLKTYFTKRILEKKGYLAGSDKNRLLDLHHHFENKNVDAIWCVRGGFGATRILPYIDYELIKNNVKIFAGYSDITALHYAFLKKSNLISFHAPMGVSEITNYNLQNIRNILFENKKELHHFKDSQTENNIEYNYKIINKGKANGQLIGGNLCLITALIGTDYNIDYKDKIVFIEEINEEPYKIDRMLTHLFQSTNIKKASAIVMGVFNKCSENNISVIQENTLTLHELLLDKFSNFKMPVIYGFSFGHIKNNSILPFGVNVEIDTDYKKIKLLENATVNNN